MRWAAVYALEHLLVPLIITLTVLYVFRGVDGDANAYVEQVNRWLGFDELVRALAHGS
jgi:hypothetical protein